LSVLSNLSRLAQGMLHDVIDVPRASMVLS